MRAHAYTVHSEYCAIMSQDDYRRLESLLLLLHLGNKPHLTCHLQFTIFTYISFKWNV